MQVNNLSNLFYFSQPRSIAAVSPSQNQRNATSSPGQDFYPEKPITFQGKNKSQERKNKVLEVYAPSIDSSLKDKLCRALILILDAPAANFEIKLTRIATELPLNQCGAILVTHNKKLPSFKKNPNKYKDIILALQQNLQEIEQEIRDGTGTHLMRTMFIPFYVGSSGNKELRVIPRSKQNAVLFIKKALDRLQAPYAQDGNRRPSYSEETPIAPYALEPILPPPLFQ